MLKSESEADDAAQEVFLKAYKNLRSFRGHSSFYTWLHSIAAHHCLDQLRKSSRQPDSLEELVDKRGLQIEEAPAEKEDLAQDLLASLSDDQRAILLLREVQGLGYQEIATALHCSLDAVKTRLYRARRDLQKIGRHFLHPRNV